MGFEVLHQIEFSSSIKFKKLELKMISDKQFLKSLGEIKLEVFQKLILLLETLASLY